MMSDKIRTLLQTVKLGLLKGCTACKVLRYRAQGIEVGRHCMFSGNNRFFRKRGGRIVLEDGVCLHSNPSCNNLITHPCSLSCIAPGAEIIMRRGSGMSGGTIVCSTRVEIGEYTMLGAGCVLYDCKQHEYSPEKGWRCSPRQNEGKPIRIGKRCFIGMNCIILKGVTIGDNCVVSAGTIITRDMPSGHLAMGNPAVYTPLSERLRTTPDGVIPLPPEGVSSIMTRI